MTESDMPPDGIRKKNPLWLRAAFFATGVALLFWLRLEDATLQTPLLIAAWVGGLLFLQFWFRHRATPCQRIWGKYPVAGILLGALIPMLAVGMTLFKSALHAHGFLEFPVADLTAVLKLSPTLGAFGLALGMGVSFWQWRICAGAD